MDLLRDQLRLDISRLDASTVRRTPQGGLDVPANLTRTGVFIYHNVDGTTRAELRPADEVFKSDSLETLRGAPLTVGHPGLVRADNWKQLAVGHVGDDVHPAGKFVEARVRVQDKSVVDQVERKDLSEISCGYTCDIEHTQGVHNGEHYDAIQRNIRYNHVALGGQNWGRAGSEVKLRMDGAAYAISMPTVEELQKEVETLRGKLTAAEQRADTADAQLGAIDLDALVKERLDLIDGAREVLGADTKFDGKSDDEIMQAAVAKAYPKVRLDGQTVDFVRGLFQAAVEDAKRGVREVARSNVRVDSSAAGVKDAIREARERSEKRSSDAWKGGN